MWRVRDMSSQKQTDKNVLKIMSNICSISIIILVFIQILGIWKKNKLVTILSLCAAILIFLVTIFIFVTR